MTVAMINLVKNLLKIYSVLKETILTNYAFLHEKCCTHTHMHGLSLVHKASTVV